MLQRGGDRKRLDDAQDDGQITRVLRDLAPSQLAFFLQALEVRKNHLHQLQDDGGGDVGHDAQSENRELAETAAAEKIEDAKNRALGLLEHFREHGGVDAWRGNVRADTVHGEQRQREQDAVPQVRNAEHVLESFDESFHTFTLRFPVTRRLYAALPTYVTTSNVPPALVILSLADALKACA